MKPMERGSDDRPTFAPGDNRSAFAPGDDRYAFAPTSEHTIGPFFPQSFFRAGDNDLRRLTPDAAPSLRGQTITLHGVVLKQGSTPCVNMVLEAFQPDSAGRFAHPADPEAHLADPDFLGWGRAWTDAEGHYSFTTLLPGGYVEGIHQRAPHINLSIMGAGLMRTARTTVFFPGNHAADPVMQAVPEAARPRLVARPDGIGNFRFDVLLHADAATETPFFQD